MSSMKVEKEEHALEHQLIPDYVQQIDWAHTPKVNMNVMEYWKKKKDLLVDESRAELDAMCSNYTQALGSVGTDELPILQVLAKPFMKRDTHWVAHVCTPTSGQPCSTCS